MSLYVLKCDYNNMIYYVKSDYSDLNVKDKVIISIDDILFSSIVINIKDNRSKKHDEYVKIIRKINKDDLKTIKNNEKDAESALKYSIKIAKELELDMNFVDSYYSFDRKQLIFDFLSDNRVDFRELAKKIAAKYKTRIELTQIGVRDKAKKVGGLGPCGLFLCCNSFLTDFNSVSINMAKNQMLALNPSKINGNCGRLLCCLGYENDNYTELKKEFPKIGSKVDTSFGEGVVVSIDLFGRSYSVDLGEKGITKVDLGEVNGKNR